MDDRSLVVESMQPAAARPSAPPTFVRGVIFALSCGASFLLYLHRYTWNFVSPAIQTQFGLNKTQAEFLFSLFYYTYAAGQIPSGVIIDRFGPRRFLTLSIVAWSLAIGSLAGVSYLVAGSSATSGSLVTVMVLIGAARLLFGAAQAGCYPALTKATKVWFAPAGRTALQGLIATTAGRSGAALSSIIFGTVMLGWLGMSWQAGLLWLSGVGLLFAVIFAFGFGDSPARDSRVNDSERELIRGPGEVTATTAAAPTMLPWNKAFRNNSLRWFVVQQFCDAGSDVAFVSLIGSYFLQAHGLNLSQSGWRSSLPLIGGAIGGIVGGALNEWWISRTGNRRWSRSGVGFVGKTLGCVMLLLVTRQESATAAAFLLMFAKFFGDWSQPTVWGTCTDMGGRFSATVFSIINTAGTIGGVVMPLVFGSLLDVFTSEQLLGDMPTKVTRWEPLFLLLAGMYLASALCWLKVDCTKSLEN